MMMIEKPDATLDALVAFVADRSAIASAAASA
jgi:hypothetical protein